ncbi:two-component system, chemotaxis family, sensor kinase CheA [Novimethylophilus kurashikiensis]|uniref:Chemotaxis protein CheA n=1 Tax=Novimethylophilus kurashikiensis TaxID=1825523 RepID=A0A2R5F631_9PROT|nr:response regulator [Novimethylophilus kurashikiensis]GBG13058.1 two-component system, chemotaxis family, sensor kinase CheA [Novimethylophilus kurashikiensis]
MPEKESDFLERLKATFRVEAQEHLAQIYAGLTALEEPGDETLRAQWIETIFREAHSLKGAAASVGYPEIQNVCHQIESTFASLKRKESSLTPQILDQLHVSVDRIGTLLEAETGIPSASVSATESVSVDSVLPQNRPVEATAAPRVLSPTLRISAEKLDAVFLKAEEMLAAKLMAQHRKQELSALRIQVDAWNKTWSNLSGRYPGLQAEDHREPGWRELLQDHTAFMKQLLQDVARLDKAAELDLRALGRMTGDLLDDMKSALLMPFSVLLESFPKLVRDLARGQGKEIDFQMRGGELQVDRRILEEIKDALVHLLRNSVDHGIELPSLRTGKGKPKRGNISLVLSPLGGERVEICIQDDGGGVNVDQVKSAVSRLGLIDQALLEKMTDEQALDLLFLSGLTTSPVVTAVSGRGLGLAIVREKVEKLGGSLQVESRLDVGTRFRLQLPNTLANYRGILVNVGPHCFVLPTRHVQRSVRVPRTDVEFLEGMQTLRIDGDAVPIISLAVTLGLDTPAIDDDFVKAVVLGEGDKKIAFSVDAVLHEQEVLVKSLGKQLVRVPNIEAATILGSGKVVPILHVPDLLKSALHPMPVIQHKFQPAQSPPAAPKRVLVAEDSITARSVLQSLLEMGGYQVTTAVDGADAWEKLKGGHFDIVVTDVEMPHMDGIDLTERIRRDSRFAHIPVVLVTSLESQQDRQRGMTAGANAYIVKRSFEQSDLLGTIAQLVPLS